MNNFLLLIFSLFFISGCATSQENSAGPYPENWKSLAMNYIQSSYVDPYSIRDSEIAPPFRSNKAFFDSWVICIRNNAKNKFGGYTGRKATDLLVQHGKIVSEDSSPSDCRNVRYEPFPVTHEDKEYERKNLKKEVETLHLKNDYVLEFTDVFFDAQETNDSSVKELLRKRADVLLRKCSEFRDKKLCNDYSNEYRKIFMPEFKK